VKEELRLDGASICIVMLSAIGDTVHVLPLIHAIKKHAPRARITWVLERAGASLMQGHPLVDEIIVHGRGLGALPALRRKIRGKFDLLLDLQVAMKAGLATAVIPATIKLGFDRARARDLNWLFTNRKIPPHEGQHVQDQYLEFLTYLEIPLGTPEWNLGPWPGETSDVANALAHPDRRVVSLTIASSVDQRDWFTDRWIELADALYERYRLQPVIVGGRSDKEKQIAGRIIDQTRAPVISTLGCSLRELVGVLDASALVISPDTAPVHMAVALDVPVITLSGYTNPRRTGPWRKFHDLLVDAYTDPGEEVNASQAYRAGRMERITVAHVLEKVELWGERYGGRGDI
jgi:heptosyltransferase I